MRSATASPLTKNPALQTIPQLNQQIAELLLKTAWNLLAATERKHQTEEETPER
jgi:hypothetical protein